MKLRPIASNERDMQLDFMRGIALMGILFLNVYVFGKSSFYIGTIQHLKGIQHLNYIIPSVFLEITMRGTLAILFAIGFLKTLEKSDTLQSADVYFKRMIGLFVLGLIDLYLFLWQGDILYVYAICGMFLFPFRSLNPKILFLLVGLLLAYMFGKIEWRYQTIRKPKYELYAAAMADSVQNHKKLNKEQIKAISEFNTMIENAIKFDTTAHIAEIKTMRGSYSEVSEKVFENYKSYFAVLLYDPIYLDIFMMMLLGLGLYKLKFFDAWSNKHYVELALIAYSIGIYFNFKYQNSIFFTKEAAIDFFKTYEIPTGSYHVFTGMCNTLGHLSMMMLLGKQAWFYGIKKVLAKVGQMALSNYLLQSIIGAFYFYGFGLGNFEKLNESELNIYVLVVSFFSIVFSKIWLKYFKMGPVEFILRRYVYS
jgi:uncharacterized protein